jgi:hypothetical protein
MRQARNWLPITVVALAVFTAPSLVQADLVCPGCPAEPVVILGVADVVELILTTVLRKGVGVLLLGATAIVSLPWLVAGVAVAFMHVPRWLRA